MFCRLWSATPKDRSGGALEATRETEVTQFLSQFWVLQDALLEETQMLVHFRVAIFHEPDVLRNLPRVRRWLPGLIFQVLKPCPKWLQINV